MRVKLLTEHHLEFLSLKRGCTGSSESTLVEMPHCPKSHVTAHLIAPIWCVSQITQVSYFVYFMQFHTFKGEHSWPKVFTPGRRQTKTPKLSRNVDQKWLETEFLIAICRQCGNKWQSKTLFLLIFDPRSSIVDSVFDCCLPGVVLLFQGRYIQDGRCFLPKARFWWWRWSRCLKEDQRERSEIKRTTIRVQKDRG